MYTIDVTDKMVLLTDGLILLILLIFVWINYYITYYKDLIGLFDKFT